MREVHISNTQFPLNRVFTKTIAYETKTRVFYGPRNADQIFLKITNASFLFI